MSRPATPPLIPPPQAVANARYALEVRAGLPKSRRGGLEPDEAAAQGIRSGVAYAHTLAESQDTPLPDLLAYYDTLRRFRGMAYKALEQGKGLETSKAIQVYLMWGGDPLLEAIKAHIEKGSP